MRTGSTILPSASPGYADGMLYHSKAGYLKIGNEGSFFPLSVELGLEMAAEFGGTPYKKVNGVMHVEPTQGGLEGYVAGFYTGWLRCF